MGHYGSEMADTNEGPVYTSSRDALAKRTPSLEQALDENDKVISMLMAQAGELYQKIAPILGPDYPSETEKASPSPEGMSVVIMRVVEQHARLRQILEQMGYQYNRVQL